MKMKSLFLCTFCMAWSVFYLHAQQCIIINTERNALVLGVNENKEVNTLYLGKKLANEEEYGNISRQYRQGTDYTGIYNSVYTPAGSKNLLEPAISVTHADGNMSLNLQYAGHKTEQKGEGITETDIHLQDPVYPVEVHVFIRAYYEDNVIEQWTTISHREKGDIILRKYASANLYLRDKGGFWLKHYHGDWAQEMQPEEVQLTHGIKVLDSKLGTRTNLFQPAVFMVSMGGPVSEDEGEVLLGGLEWSGNFRTDLELDPLNNLRIISGINNYASAYRLEKDETFTTPVFFYTLSQQGAGKASRDLHSWARDHKILDGRGERLILLNNWEATYFDFDETKLQTLIRDSKKLGVDLFLLDDGWFGNAYPRNSDNAGLGDWQVNRKKLPNGIATLIETAKENRVKFGIWIEPEMVNPESELYRKHPDWVIRQPERPEHYFRNQLVLDLSNPEVQDFVFDVVDNLFTENPELAYIKWDCNAVIYNARSANLKEDQSHLYADYVTGLYKVLERIRKKYPEVPMMLCSGGGGRVDYGALKYFTEFWPSDNTDPLERIYMQWEYSYFYPALTMAAHVTNWGKQSIKFKTDVAMMGKLGFDIVVDELSAEELQFCQGALNWYDRLKHTIWQGTQYRLQDPWTHDVASLMYVDDTRNEAVVFSYLTGNRYEAGSTVPIRLKGLDATKKYTVSEINLYPGTKPEVKESVYSGDFLMQVGINPLVNANRKSVILKVSVVN